MQTHNGKYILEEGVVPLPIQRVTAFKGSLPRSAEYPASGYETEYTFKPVINNTLLRKALKRKSD
ncbi:hypothetical protein BIU88_06640 [Chlorobaculum limnaeum]|uniref:Uncharacterized protein n=1 Tax=Chlorobaculum limnaeum TaxID=274537 RepID=A0A1D8D2N7_CHLLM|nr:hypothetical protein BIU88_06640 [Chlorobaculum limnaeum]